MRKRVHLLSVLLPAMMLVAFLVAAAAQTQPQAAQATPPPMPPDRKAYSDAMAIKEADKKIEALNKFIADFPSSPQVSGAHLATFDVLVKNFPDQKARIREQAAKALERTVNPQVKANTYNTMAGLLCDAGILIEDAEKFATLALAEIESESARIEANPPAPPNPNPQGNPNPRPAPNPLAGLNRLKPNVQVNLGRIYQKQGKLDEAQKSFKDVLATNPLHSAASLGLAEICEKRGDSANALTAYLNAAAVSKIPASARQALNALYAKAHKGSLAGLEEALDAKYLEVNPPPFAVEPYTATEKRTSRVVLTEVFTGSGCPPCVAADLAADLAMERYGKNMAMLVYHEHIPQPDPMTTPQTTARFKYYNGRGVPTLAIDGVATSGGGGRDATKPVFERLTKEIEKQLEVPAGAGLRLTAGLKGATVKADVVLDKLISDAPELKLHIVLAEEKLRYTGENGVRFHPMVVRSMAGPDGTGLNIDGKGTQKFSWDFDLKAISTAIKDHLDAYEAGGHRGNSFTFTEKKYEINPKDLLVVAFVQDEKTKAILQSVVIPITAR